MRQVISRVAAVTLVAAAVTFSGPAHAAQEDSCAPAGKKLASIPWPQQMLAPERAWPVTTGDGQRVAVISTGVDDNSHLAGRIAVRVDVAPREKDNPTTKPDCLGVGTGVAGIIAGNRREGRGFSGLAPDATILSLKVTGDRYPDGMTETGAVAPATLAKAINLAVEHDATVIAVATIAYEGSAELRNAVHRAHHNDVVVVAATGDARRDDPAFVIPYPAVYQDVIRVAAIDANGSRAKFTRDFRVHLVAPGAKVVTTYPSYGLGPASGTAFATGYVSGAAALVRSHHPELSRAEVAQRLFATALPANEGSDGGGYGYGIVSPYHAVVDRVGEGTPVSLPGITRHQVSAAERKRQAALQESDDWAAVLISVGIGATILITGLLASGKRGQRRRWRGGLARVPQDPREAERPEPPFELFADRLKRPEA